MVGLALLMVLWGTSYYCWRQLLTAFNEHRRNVALACSLLYLATVPALVCRQTENLTMALAIAVGMLILLVFGLRRHIERQLPIVFPPFSMTFAAKIIAVLTSVLVFWTLYQGYFWDENAAHFGVSSVLARGVSPPEHPLFPGQVFRYHYGFNVLVGQVMALSGCSVAIAIDIVGAVCFIALLVSAISAGYQLGGSKAASLAIVLLPLAGGTLQHLLFSDFGVLEWHWDLMPKSWYQNIPPPVISNFFQHPQGLAMGTALGVIQLFDDSNSNIKRYATGAIMLGFLSLAHVVFFGLIGLGLGISCVVRNLKPLRLGSLAYQLGLLTSALIIAFLLGGFFGFGDAAHQFLSHDRDFFNERFLLRITHHLVLFGLPLIMLPFAFWHTCTNPSTLRITALSIAIIGFLVPNFITYERSWDIVKFFGVAAFFANLLLADSLARFIRPKAVLVSLVILSCSTSVLWLSRTSFLDGHSGIPKMHFQPPPRIAEKVAGILNPLLAPRDRVYSTNIDMSKAGLLTPGFQWQQFGRGYMMDRKEVGRLFHHARAARRSLNHNDLSALEVKFLILNPSDIAGLDKFAKAALNDPKKFRKITMVETPLQKRTIYEVLYK